jgi:3-deoxy-7-phosphoheptulonate synthase
MLRSRLADVAAGRALVLQAGDCAEDPAECTMDDVARKVELLNFLAELLRTRTHKPVIRVGRIGGQFMKPRSNATEVIGGVELPAYRGHLVNGSEPDPLSRRHDPRRLLMCYHSARQILDHLGWPEAAQHPRGDTPVWASHEALLLDYEIPLLRRHDAGLLLTSTHWPWIGERTRQTDGGHVGLLADVVNPVACKVGPTANPGELVELCRRLDPGRQPGRLTFIARMGAELVAERLPALVAAVRAAGHPVIWLCDPMHGNTIRTPTGLKTRVVQSIIRELRVFQSAVSGADGIVGGLHLETTPDEVTECVSPEIGIDRVGDKYTSLCDPRLNPRQAKSVVRAWPQSFRPAEARLPSLSF